MSRGERQINVGSRKSQLALIQTQIVLDKLSEHYIDKDDKQPNFTIVAMTTVGDRIMDKALAEIGSKSLFTKDLEFALLEGKIDCIVHSLKDVPTHLPEGCVIGAILKRDDPNDVVVLQRNLCDKSDPIDLILNDCAVVGTSSVRRISMLLNCNPLLKCKDIRGNLNTRLSKLDGGEYSALVLAKAGLDRMGWTDRASVLLSPESDSRFANWCYAVGQGAIAIECRENDQEMIDLLAPICDTKTTFEVIAERSLLKSLEGGCSVPLGVRSTWAGDILKIRGIVMSRDGKRVMGTEKETCLSAAVERSVRSHSFTTGVVMSEQRQDVASIKLRMIACFDLGLSLAEEMISLGCRGLMQDSRLHG